MDAVGLGIVASRQFGAGAVELRFWQPDYRRRGRRQDLGGELRRCCTARACVLLLLLTPPLLLAVREELIACAL